MEADLVMRIDGELVTLTVCLDGREVLVITLEAHEALEYGQALLDAGMAVQRKGKP